MLWPRRGSRRVIVGVLPQPHEFHRDPDDERASARKLGRWYRSVIAALLTVTAVLVAGCAQQRVAAEASVLARDSSEPRPHSAPALVREPIGTDSPAATKPGEAAALFPLGIFSVPQADIPHAASLGFNLVHTYQGEGSVKQVGSAASIEWLQDYLRTAAAAGVGAMLGLPRRHIVEGDEDELRRRIEQLRGVPALRVWYLFDEPDVENVPASVVDRTARLLGELDGTRPRVLVLAQRPQRLAGKGYLDIGDVIMVDPYPYVRAGSDVSSVYRHVAEAALLTRGRQQVWATVQAHGRGPGGKGFGLLEPPYLEMRNMAFQAIAAGASGLFFFCYKCGQFELTRTPRGLDNLSRVVGEIRGLSALLLSQPPSRSLFRVTAAPGVVYRAFEHDGFLWLLAVNTTRTELRFSAELRAGKLPAQILIPAEQRFVASADGRLDEALRPLDARLYQMSPP